MADRPFSYKMQSSLVGRIFYSCMGLLVIPLILGTVVVYVSEYQSRMRTVYFSLEIAALGREAFLESIVAEEFAEIRTKGERVSLNEGVFPQKVAETLEEGRLIFPEVDPRTKEKQIYFAEAAGRDAVFLLPIPASRFVSDLIRLPGRPFDFHMALLFSDRGLYYSDDPNLQLGEVDYLKERPTTREWLSLLWNRADMVGIKRPWKGTDLELAFFISADAYRSVTTFSALSAFLVIFFFIFVLGFGVAYWVTRRMAKPLRALCLQMAKVGEGDLTARYQQDPYGLEVNALGASFNQMVDSLVCQIDLLNRERIARESLETELKIGQAIQKSLLPTRPVEYPGLDIAAGFQAAQEVAGDFYDLFVTERGLMVSVGDASGKGISACLYSLGVRSLLRSFSLCYPHLDDVLHATNQVFCKDTEETHHFVTAWVANFDPKTFQLEYGSAGHPPALLLRSSGGLIELETDGIALGAIETGCIKTRTISLSPGDLLVLYSDGITEAHNPEGELFGKRRMLDLLSTLQGRPAREVIEAIELAVEVFSGAAAQHDDLTILAVRLLPNGCAAGPQ